MVRLATLTTSPVTPKLKVKGDTFPSVKEAKSPKLFANTPKNTLYFRSATELAHYQEANILLTANEQL